jgi:hypothetical protein
MVSLAKFNNHLPKVDMIGWLFACRGVSLERLNTTTYTSHLECSTMQYLAGFEVHKSV